MEQPRDKELKAVIHRCPYCHESADAEGSVACQGCLARHHEACWRESGRCGSCGAVRPLEPAALPPLSLEQAERALRAEGYTQREVQGFFHTLTNKGAAPRQARLGGVGLVMSLALLVGGVVSVIAIREDAATGRERREAEREDDERRRMETEKLRAGALTLQAKLDDVQLRLAQARAELARVQGEDPRVISSVEGRVESLDIEERLLWKQVQEARREARLPYQQTRPRGQ